MSNRIDRAAQPTRYTTADRARIRASADKLAAQNARAATKRNIIGALIALSLGAATGAMYLYAI